MENKRQDIIIDDRLDNRTYFDYLKLKDVNTKHFLMFSELIDNSISSFENKFGDNWQETLNIKVHINFNGKEKNILGMDIIENSFIKVTDNAFGMDESTLKYAIKLNRKASNSFSKMNVHGRGLKQCAFYFGIDLTVKTTNENNDSYIVDLKTSNQKSVDEPIIIEPRKDSEERSRGTTIIIENIFKDKIFNKNTFGQIINALQFRYINYLKSKNISIIFHFNDNKNPISLEIPEEPKISMSEVFCNKIFGFGEIKNNVDFLREIKNDIDRKVKIKGDEVEYSIVLETYEKISDLITTNKLLQDSKNNFEFSILFDFIVQDDPKETKKLKMNFWMLPVQKSIFRGIRLFEGKRAICHPGYQELETKPYMDWKNGKMESGSTENRFAGECDLSELGLVSKTDKSSFTIPQNIKDQLDTKIRSVWFAFNQFIIKDRQIDKKISPMSKNDKLNFDSMFKSKFPNKNINHLKEENIFETNDENFDVEYFSYNSLDNKLWKIKITLNKEDRPVDIVKIKYNKNNEENLELIIFQEHNFFHKMNKLKNDFHFEALYPISLLIAIQYIESISDINGKKHTTVDLINHAGTMLDYD